MKPLLLIVWIWILLLTHAVCETIRRLSTSLLALL
jgi:hypothetical protein